VRKRSIDQVSTPTARGRAYLGEGRDKGSSIIGRMQVLLHDSVASTYQRKRGLFCDLGKRGGELKITVAGEYITAKNIWRKNRKGKKRLFFWRPMLCGTKKPITLEAPMGKSAERQKRIQAKVL